MFQEINHATIGKLDNGDAAEIIDAAIKEAVKDFDDRSGEDGKPRKVVIELTFERRDNGEAEVSVEAHAKIPKRRTASTVCRLRFDKENGSKLQFNDLATDDPNQTTIDMHLNKNRRQKTEESEGE